METNKEEAIAFYTLIGVRFKLCFPALSVFDQNVDTVVGFVGNSNSSGSYYFGVLHSKPEGMPKYSTS